VGGQYYTPRVDGNAHSVLPADQFGEEKGNIQEDFKELPQFFALFV
jgi:hypothetical protein